MSATLGAMARLPEDAVLDVPEPLDDKGGIMLSIQAPTLSFNFAGIDFYALHDMDGITPTRFSAPMPSTAVSLAYTPDDRFSFGGEIRLATESYAPKFCPIPGRKTVLCADIFAIAGVMTTPILFDDGNCIMFFEGTALFGVSWRTNYDWSTVCPSMGLSARLHLGRRFITMAFGLEATAALDIIGPEDERTVMFALRPNLSLAWRWS